MITTELHLLYWLQLDRIRVCFVHPRAAASGGARARAHADGHLALLVRGVSLRPLRPDHGRRDACFHCCLHREPKHDADDDERRRNSLPITPQTSAPQIPDSATQTPKETETKMERETRT